MLLHAIPRIIHSDRLECKLRLWPLMSMNVVAEVVFRQEDASAEQNIVTICSEMVVGLVTGCEESQGSGNGRA